MASQDHYTLQQHAGTRRRTVPIRSVALLLAIVLTLPTPFASAGLLADSVGSFKIAADLSRRSSQEMAVKQAVAIITSYTAGVLDANADGDPFPEAPSYVTGAGPAGGGLVPTNVGAPLGDGYGGKLGYCSWDNGAVVSAGNRLAGSVTNLGAPVFAVVSAGLDGVFNRSCAQIAANTNTNTDDFVVSMSTLQIRQGVGGTLYFADPVADKAALDAIAGTRDGELRLVKTTNALWRWNVSLGAWVGAADAYNPANVQITGGQINGTVIGNTGAAAGSFTTLNASGAINGNLTGNVTGNVTGNLTGNVTGSVAGNAATASKLLAPATIGISGDAAWSVSFDGSANVTGALTLANSGVVAGSYGSATMAPSYTVDSKGRLVAAANVLITPAWASITATPTTAAGYGIITIDNVPIGATTQSTGTFTTLRATGQILAAGGTAGAPGYSFFGDTNTGFYSTQGDELAGSVGGTRALWIYANQVALGRGALANPSGDFNTAVGLSALAATTSGFSNTALGDRALTAATTGDRNTAVGAGALTTNSTGSYNTAVGLSALGGANATGNTAMGFAALGSMLTGGDNVGIGYSALRFNTSGNANAALGRLALSAFTAGSTNVGVGYATGFTTTNAPTGSNNVFVGANSTLADTAFMAGSGRMTLLGADATASGLAAANANAYMTAIGSGSSVTTANTVVLGRAADATVIGATADDLSGNKLQVTGGIKAVTGGLTVAAGGATVAGGNLVLSSAAISGTFASMGAAGTANRIYVSTDTKEIYRDNGTTWDRVAVGAPAATSLSGLTNATANNTLTNAAFAQAWNWALTGNTTAFALGETAASTGGTGTQYLAKVGTLAASTAIPLSVSTRGTEAFRVDSTNPQILARLGTAALPTYSFSGNASTGFYSPATNELAASVGGIRGLWIQKSATASVAFGYYAMDANTTGTNNVGAGLQALYNNTQGNYNTGAGSSALYLNTIGSNNTATGASSLAFAQGSNNAAFGYAAGNTSNNVITSGKSTFIGTNATIADTAFMAGSGRITLLGADALASGLGAANANAYMTAIGSGSSVTTVNTVVLGRTTDKTVIGTTSDDGNGAALQVVGAIQGSRPTSGAGLFLINSVGGANAYVDIAAATYLGATNSSPATIRFIDDGNFSNVIAFRSKLNGAITNADQENMRITGVGHVLIGAAVDDASGNLLQVTGGIKTTATVTALRANFSDPTGGVTVANMVIGAGALAGVPSGNSANIAIGSSSLSANSSGTNNVAVGVFALNGNTTGSQNTAFGVNALRTAGIASNNAAFGDASLYSNTSGSSNLALGRFAGYSTSTSVATNANTTGSNNTFVGAYAMPGTATQLTYATALGSDALVTTASTIVLGRATDKTVIGATGTDGSANALQVTGGIKALTGGLTVAGGNLVLSSAAVSGTFATMGAAGTANRIYVATDTKEIYRDNGATWDRVAQGTATVSLSGLTAATANNTLANAANAQAWNWALTGATTGFSIGETSASTGGAGSQYLAKIGTLAASTAIPLSVSARGVEAFRVDSVNPQIVASSGSLAAPTYSFSAQQSTGFYLPASGQLGASVAGSRSMLIDSTAFNTGLGYKAINAITGGSNNTGIGYQALAASSGGGSNSNTAVGYNALNQFSGTGNTAVGSSAGANSSSGGNNTLIGESANISGSVSNGTALGQGAIVSSSNTVVLGRTSDSVSIGQTGSGAYKLTVNGTAGGTSAYAVSSDQRFKTNITPVINALATVSHLQGVHYEFNHAAFPERNFESGRQLGFIAQQIEAFVPEVVRIDRDGFRRVQYSQIVPLLAEAIKEQQLVLHHLVKKDPTTLLVDIKTFQANDAIFDNIKAAHVKATTIDADSARINRLEAKSIVADVMKTGELVAFVNAGSFQPIFSPTVDGQYLVNALADDGSTAFASVGFMGGKVTVTAIGGKGIEITSIGVQVGLVATGKKIKATWIRMS